MPRLVDGLLAGALVGGVWWYVRRDQRKAGSESTRAERLAELAHVRARLVRERASELAGGAAASAPTVATASESPPIAKSGKPAGLSRRFDELFARHGRGIPVAFLRALAAAESGMNPDDRLGLINVVPIALADYNRRHSSAPFRAEEMRDPAKNITVAADILRTIIDSYRKHHPDVPNLLEDWSNPHFARLLVFGWNGGFSELAGVGRVVTFLETLPVDHAPVRRADITIDSVFEAAWSARAASHLSNPRKLAYSKGVAAAYFRERVRDQRDLVG